MATKTVMFIHGMFMTPLCWEEWIKRFEFKGYRCLAPAWLYHDAPVEVLRKKFPDPALGKLTMGDLVMQFTALIQAASEKPILIGHSMGGLLAQLLLNRGLGAAGIVVHSGPPQGVFVLSYPYLKSSFPIINPLKPVDEPMWMSFKQFQYSFVNTLPLPEQQAVYEKYCVPESRRVGRSPLTPVTHIDYEKTRVPLIFFAGGADHIIPAALNRANFVKYQKAGAPVEYREFAGRSHFTIREPGWEQVADAAMAWIEEKGV